MTLNTVCKRRDVFQFIVIPVALKKTLTKIHMLIYGLYGNSYGHLEKSMMLKLQLNCRIDRN